MDRGGVVEITVLRGYTQSGTDGQRSLISSYSAEGDAG